MNKQNNNKNNYYQFAFVYGERVSLLENRYGDVYLWRTIPYDVSRCFMKALKSDENMKFIDKTKSSVRRRNSFYVGSYYATFENFLVTVKSSNCKSRKIPLIVERCDEGFKDAIFGIIFDISKYYKNYKTFENFDISHSISASYLADLIKDMNDEELEDYFVKVTKFAQFIDNYGLSLVRRTEEIERVEKQKELEEQKRELEEQKNASFVANFQRSRAQAIKEKYRN